MAKIDPPRSSRGWTLKQRLDHRSVRDPKSGCVLWAGTLAPTGYGMLRSDKRTWYAHRAAWVCRHGEIPSGLYVCHRCDVRACINPDHLFLGTQKDNMIDKALKMGHGRREEGVPERRPHKAPEIMWIWIGEEEIVARVLHRKSASPSPGREAGRGRYARRFPSPDRTLTPPLRRSARASGRPGSRGGR